MKQLLVKENRKLDELKKQVIDSLEELEQYVESLHNKATDYSGQRGDIWYDSDTCKKFYEWENRIEEKSELIRFLKDDIEEIVTFDDIRQRDIEKTESNKTVLLENTITINNKIDNLFSIQRKLIQRMK